MIYKNSTNGLLNGDKSKNKTDIYSCVHIYTTSKQIELESPGCAGFKAF